MKSKRPNILHLFTDMQRFDTIHALGNPVIKTPHLDRLCREGVAFTHAYSPSPVCVSARCSMIMGQYPLNTGCYANGVMPTDDRKTFMEVLTDDGYRTHGIGKCHFTPDKFALRGFESREIQEEVGETPENLDRHDYMKYLHDKGYDHICEANGIRGEMYYTPQPSQVTAKDHPTQWIGDRSIAFLQKEQESPWYLYTSFIHPHPPFNPPNPWHKLYRPAMMPHPDVPEDWESLLTFINRVQNRYKYGDQGINRHHMRLIKAYYYACISFVDYQIGRILKALEETGELDNTLILFASDHGEHLGDRNSFGKRSMHDSSARVPMIIRQPGRFEGGVVCDTPVSLVDIAPTFLTAAGNRDYAESKSVTTHALDGVDMYDILSGESKRKVVFSQFSNKDDGLLDPALLDMVNQNDPDIQRAHYSSYMAVSKEAKYIYSAPDDREFFFDRIADPFERRNRAGVTLLQDKKSAIKQKLIDHLKAGGETAGIDGDGWKHFPRLSINPDPDTGLIIQDGYTPWADMSLPEEYSN
jgi:arylsulfatase